MKRFHTPEEAKKMRCCQGNIIHCLADTCMAWRWKSKELKWVKDGTIMSDEWVKTDNPEPTINVSGEEDGRKYVEYEKIETETTGFCGLAHSPSWYD